MNKEDKYYIPDIEDIWYGYEYEELWQNIPVLNAKLTTEWRTTVFGHSHDVNEYNRLRCIITGKYFGFETDGDLVRVNQIRVPYLTNKQIEGEGWKHEWWEDGAHSWTKGSIVLTSFDQNHRLLITHGTGYIIFHGECKSINELRYICKLLEI